MFRNIFRFQTPVLSTWLLIGFGLLFIQMYLSTGTLSAYAATLEKPALYKGYYVNYDWPQYVANYFFIKGEDHTLWEHGFVLRRLLLYVVGYPFFMLFGFFVGSMITIMLSLLATIIFFLRFVEKEFGVIATKTAMVLLCTYSGITYWIGSPFVQNLIVPLCLLIYMILWKMKDGSFRFNIIGLFLIGILFTGYDLLPLFAPGILLFLFFNNHFHLRERWVLIGIGVFAFLLPQAGIKLWLYLRGYEAHYSNEESYKIIITAYLNITKMIPEWLFRVRMVPSIFYKTFLYSNFILLPSLFLVTLILGNLFFSFRMNLLERCLLFSVAFLFFFNNMAPPYEGEWQMWGDWLSRIYQAVFVVYLMYIVRFTAHLYLIKRMEKAIAILLLITMLGNFIINTGGLYASPLTSYVYGKFYQHGKVDSYRKNILYYGARPYGFPVHYESEAK